MKWFLVFLILLSSQGIRAQEPDPVQEPEEPEEIRKGARNCRIVFPERPKSSPKIAYIFDGKKSQRVNLPSMNFLEVIALPPGDLTILMTSSEITDLENLPLSAPRLKIPEGAREFYILITPDTANSIFPVAMNLVHLGGGKLKPGETLWFNLTEHRILRKFADSRMNAPHKGQTVTSAPMPESGYYRAEFAYLAQAKGEPRRITEQSWWHSAESRHLGFIVDSGGRLPKIYRYRDFR